MTPAEEIKRLHLELSLKDRQFRMACEAYQAALRVLHADCRAPVGAGEIAVTQIGGDLYLVPNEVAAEINRLRLAKEIRRAALDAGGKELPDGRIDMSGTPFAPMTPAPAPSPDISPDIPGVHVCSKVLGELNEFPSWRLHKLSPTTYPQDLGVRCPTARAMEPQLKAMMADGQAFRCRIGLGPFFYSRTLDDAARQAIEHSKAVPPIRNAKSEIRNSPEGTA